MINCSRRPHNGCTSHKIGTEKMNLMRRRNLEMRDAIAAAVAFGFALIGTAVSAQSINLQNPGVSTTPGVTQPTTPSTPTVTVQNIQNIPVGPQPQAQGAAPVSALQFSSINTAAPVVYPSAFATSNVLSTQSPQATVAQPLPSAGASAQTTTSGSISPAMAVFTFTPSQQFVPVSTPRPYLQPNANQFKPR
jgi:hypothetical protein